MKINFRVFVLLALFLYGWILVPNLYAANNCSTLFTSQSSEQEKIFHKKEFAEIALKIMMEGSLNVSRTKVLGRRFIAPTQIKNEQIAIIAETNFKKAARFVLKNFDSLDINLKTAVILNKILTKGLVPESVRGQYDFRIGGTYVKEIDQSIGYHPRDFYITWLNSPEAKSLYTSSPIEFAEILHNTIMSLDSFPDGNGRLSRLFADLALIKNNISPAYYTSMQDYFDRGNARSEVPRHKRKIYFNEIVIRGMSLLGLDLGWIPTKQHYFNEEVAYAA